MIDPGRLLLLAAARLRAATISWAVIGGLAVSARAVPRFTQDVDLAVAVASDAEAEQLVLMLTRSGFRLASLLEQAVAGRLATVRLAMQEDASGTAVLDLLFASSGIEPEVVAAATPIDLVPGLRLPVATIGYLIALKVLSRDDDTRPQDIIDLRNLIIEATPGDLETARGALVLIAERGYDRGKSLQTDLDALLARFRPGG